MDSYLIGDDIRLDITRRQVFKGDTQLNLPELSYRLLVTLVQQAPHIVDHDTLIQSVWQERVVSDESLKKRVSRLRQSLGDNTESPLYIQAERGMGYRLLAKVEKQTAPLPDRRKNNKTLPNKRLFLASFCLMFCVLIMWKSVTPEHKQNIETQLATGIQYYALHTPQDNLKARQAFFNAIKSAPDTAEAFAALTDTYSQGYAYYGEDERAFEQAQIHAQRAISLSKDSAWAHTATGYFYYLKGKPEQALPHLLTAVQLAPNWGRPHAHLAQVYLAKEAVITAHQHAKHAMALDPDNPLSHQVYGTVLRDRYSFSLAKKQLSDSRVRFPNAVQIQYQLAELALAQGKHQDAGRGLDQVIAQAPHFQAAHWLKGHLALLQQDNPNAINSFRHAADLGGRLTLPAQVYLAALEQQPLPALTQALQQKIAEGTHFGEYPFSLAFILAAQGKIEETNQAIALAMAQGFHHEYRLETLAMSDALNSNPDWLRNRQQLASQNNKKRVKRLPPVTPR